MRSSQRQYTPVIADGTPGTSSPVTAEIGKAPIRGRRRSQRVRFEMPVGMYRYRENQGLIFEEGKTLHVNAHGALLALATPAVIGEMLRLINPRTRQEIECRVCPFDLRYLRGVNHVGVEFLEVSPTFWDVDPRPLDWDPAWEPSAERVRPQISRLPAFPTGPAREMLQSRSLASSVKAKKTPASQQASSAPQVRKSRVASVFNWPMVTSGVFLVLVACWTGIPNHRAAVPLAPWVPVSQVLAPEDAGLISDSDNFRLATTADFDPEAISWLHSSGPEASGEIPGAYSGAEKSDAYVLIGKNGMQRVLIMANGQVRCDAQYRTIALAVRVPRISIEKIDWSRPPGESDGDGLLIVATADHLGSSVVLFLDGQQVVSGTPIDYHQVLLHRTP